MPSSPSTISQARFRDVLGNYCSGVTVISAIDGQEPVGFACQSFQSVSLDPPMVSFAPAKTSTTWPRIQRAGQFVANILTENQSELCRQFATSGEHKFRDVAWRASPAGLPLLQDVLAWVDCTIVNTIDAGDHAIVLGEVTHLATNPDQRPLLFFRGTFHRLAH